MCFCLLYKIYLTRVGKWLHKNALAKINKDKYETFVSFENSFDYHNGMIRVMIVPYLKDNYGFIIFNSATKEYCLVDPADFDLVQKVLSHFEIQGPPSFILTTVITINNIFSINTGIMLVIIRDLLILTLESRFIQDLERELISLINF